MCSIKHNPDFSVVLATPQKMQNFICIAVESVFVNNISSQSMLMQLSFCYYFVELFIKNLTRRFDQKILLHFSKTS